MQSNTGSVVGVRRFGLDNTIVRTALFFVYWRSKEEAEMSGGEDSGNSTRILFVLFVNVFHVRGNLSKHSRYKHTFRPLRHTSNP